MPSSKSSTSNREARVRIVQRLVDEGDYKTLLLELLSYVYRDGGQYTELAGIASSFDDALDLVVELHRKNAALSARIGQLVNK